jgi:hypothetical protein
MERDKNEESSEAAFKSATGRGVRLAILILIAVIELGLVVYLAWIEHLFLGYFTYLHKVAYLIMLWLLILSNIEYHLFQWACIFLMPFMLGTSLVISIGITILAFLRPQLLVDDFQQVGWTADGVGLVHTADWLFHQLPLVETIIIAFCLYKYMAGGMRYILDTYISPPAARTVLILYVCAQHIIFLLIYVLIAPFITNYYLGEPGDAALPIILLVITALFASVIDYFAFFHLISKKKELDYAGQTLLKVSSPALVNRIRQYSNQSKQANASRAQDNSSDDRDRLTFGLPSDVKHD